MSATTWQLDAAHSEVLFRVRHLMVSTVSGKFTKFNSSVSAQNDEFGGAQIEFNVETGSIDTGVEHRDNHLRSDDFFNAEQFPHMTFKSRELKKTGAGTYELHGDLTIRDITKPVTLQVELGGIAKDPYGNTKAGFEVTGKINRKEFGLKWDAITEAGGAVVADEVRIHANVQYSKVEVAEAAEA
jgi:polyisoprenoid-binding protein YceI